MISPAYTVRVILLRIWPKVFGTTYGTNRYANDQYGRSARNPTGNGSQLDSSSKPRSAARNTWKPKFAKHGSGFLDRGPFSKSQNTAGRLERIDSNDDSTELRPTNFKTHIASSVASRSGSLQEMDPKSITVSSNVEVKY